MSDTSKQGPLKQAFVHCADLHMAPGADPAGPGGAVTVALCGSWDHAGPCRWPHLTEGSLDDGMYKVRVVFAASEEDEPTVRARIDEALARGRCVGPDGGVSVWTLSATSAGALNSKEREWGARMTRPES